MPTLVDRSETLAVEVACSDDALAVVLDDGRTVSVPLVWFPRLLNATPKQRKEWEFIGGGIGIHWEAIDEDLGSKPAQTGEVHAAGSHRDAADALRAAAASLRIPSHAKTAC